MTNKRKVFCDIEANGLKPTKIWCIVCKDIDTKEIFTFSPNHPNTGHIDWQEDFKKFSKEVSLWIGHNFISYDSYWIEKILNIKIPLNQIEDTLVMSRLFRPTPVTNSKEIKRLYSKGLDNRIGGHSLEAWGNRLKFKKGDYNNWDYFTEEMLEYCIQDVNVVERIYEVLQKEKEGFSKDCIKLEHKVAYLLALQERNGFFLDQKVCKALAEETKTLLEEMNIKLQKIFPPIKVLDRQYYEIKYTKDGEMGKVSKRIIEEYKTNPNKVLEEIEKDKIYNLYSYQTFNPESSKQVGERLLALGWEPKKYTPTGRPSTDKKTLVEALENLIKEKPDLKEIQCLADFNIIADRHQKALKWLTLVEDDGRVHGKINPIGASTHRCSHYADNMANIARVVLDENKKPLKGLKGKFGWESRACWSVPSNEDVLVGADASGIQLRALAHYMNDKEYTRKLLEDDIHTVNGKAAGILMPNGAVDRPSSKTFIYAWLLGAGDELIGNIVGVPSENEYEDLFSYALSINKWGDNLRDLIIKGLRKDKRKATQKTVATVIKGFKVKRQFLDRTPALKRLKEKEIPLASKRGFLIGLDGRKLWIPSQHLAMSLYLQGFEAVVMKLAMCLYTKELNDKKIPFKQTNFVHDEWSIETKKDYGEEVGEACIKAIKKAGKLLKTNCPLDGEYKIGRHWGETH